MGGQYDVAQICRNGHVITKRARGYPQHQKKFCDRCGAEGIMLCPTCGTPIQGEYDVPGVLSFTDTYRAPAYCPGCSKPYPWTAERLNAAEELVDLADQLTDDERAALKRDLPFLTIDSPRTQVATVRSRQLLAKIRNEAGPALRTILTSIVTDAVKKGLGL